MWMGHSYQGLLSLYKPVFLAVVELKKIITSFSKDHPHTHGMRALFFVGFVLFVHDSLLAK